MKERFKTSIYIVLATVLAIVSKFLPYSIGTSIFDIFALCIAIVAGFEMCNILEKCNKKTNKYLASMYGIFDFIILLACLSGNGIDLVYIPLIQLASFAVYFAIILIAQLCVDKASTFKDNAKVALNSLLACIYPGFLFCLMLTINHIDFYTGILNSSMVFIIMIFAITYLTDTFAYLVGRTFKGPKLAPSISPNKTISGAIGGLLGGMAGAMLVYAVVYNVEDWAIMLTKFNLSWWHFLIIGAIASVFGQCGDLFESKLKRKANIKDSGAIFPGHGGMLDRIDAMTFVTTVIFVATLFIVL